VEHSSRTWNLNIFELDIYEVNQGEDLAHKY